MAEKPILFTTDEVKATLEDRKSQKRLIVKPQPEIQNRKSMLNSPYYTMDDGSLIFATAGSLGEHRNPPCQPGDTLWVREMWGIYVPHWHDTDRFIYMADYPDGAKGYWFEPEHVNWCDLPNWRPSLHMPREAARLFLRVKKVRVERLQEITEEDARAEGVVDGGCLNCGNSSYPNPCGCNSPQPDYRDSFVYLWDSAYSKRGYGWDVNPWVWVVEFERVNQ